MDRIKKLYPIIAIGLVLFIALGLLLLLNFLPRQKPPSMPVISPSPTFFQQATPTVKIIDQNEEIKIGEVVVRNFYRNYEKINSQSDVVIEEKNNYQLVYLANFQQFIISVLATPFEENREQAEEAFLTKLGISQKEACKLKVIINTPQFVNPELAGQNYPLSFCRK